MFIEAKTYIDKEEKNINRIWISSEFLKTAEQIEKKNIDNLISSINLETEFIETAKLYYEGKCSNFRMLDSSEVYSLVLKSMDFNANEYKNFYEYVNIIENSFKSIKCHQYNKTELILNFLRKISKQLELEVNNRKTSNCLIGENEGYYEFIK